jgi:DNA replication initiation complex subunit (GINS family)
MKDERFNKAKDKYREALKRRGGKIVKKAKPTEKTINEQALAILVNKLRPKD